MLLETKTGHAVDCASIITLPSPSDFEGKINKFADATSDHQWIHVDEERAKKEMPDGKTIAHGYYMVSLLPKLAAQNAEIKNTSRTLNYGSDKVRFINMVKVGSHVRLNRTIIPCEKMKNGEVAFVEFIAPFGEKAYVTFKDKDGKKSEPIRIGE